MNRKHTITRILTAVMLAAVLGACGSGSGNTSRVDAQFSLGSKTSSAYFNKFFDIAFTVPDDNWRILSDEEIALTVSATQEALKDVSSVKAALENGDTYFDVIALDQTTNGQINVIIGRAPESITAEELIDEGLAEVGGALESMGASSIDGTRTTAMFRGERVPASDIRFSLSGLDVYEKQVVIIKGSYVANITVSSYGTDRTDEYLELITKN